MDFIKNNFIIIFLLFILLLGGVSHHYKGDISNEETPIETVPVCDINDASGCDDMIAQNGSGPVNWVCTIEEPTHCEELANLAGEQRGELEQKKKDLDIEKNKLGKKQGTINKIANVYREINKLKIEPQLEYEKLK